MSEPTSPGPSNLPAAPATTWAERAKAISTDSAFEPATISDAIQLAQAVARAQLVPKHFQERPADILVAMLMARQMGIPGIVAVQNGHVINGKFGLPASMIHGLCEQDPNCEYFVIAEADETHCTVEVKRREWPQARSMTYTMEMAKRAGYTSKNPNYATNPRNMLIARARSEAARAFFPGRVSGLYSAEELRDIPAEPASDAPALAAIPVAGRLDAIANRPAQVLEAVVLEVPSVPVEQKAPPAPQAAPHAPIPAEAEPDARQAPEAPSEAPTLFSDQPEAPPAPTLSVPMRARLAADADRRLGRGASKRLIDACIKQFGSWEKAPPEAAVWASEWIDRQRK